MNDDDRKFLTEWGGDCWHGDDLEKTYDYLDGVPVAMVGARCRRCGAHTPLFYRTFDNPDDYWWLWEKMVKRYLITQFIDWLGHRYNYDFYDWVLDCSLEHRCQLILDFLREGRT